MEFDGKDGCLKLIVNDYGYLKYDIWVFVRLQGKAVPILPIQTPKLKCTPCTVFTSKDRTMAALSFVKLTE